MPSPESWAAVQKILDDKEGVCGFVLDKVDIAGVLEGLIAKGFNVRLPTEKIKPMAVPVGIAPTMNVRGEPVTIEVKVGQPRDHRAHDLARSGRGPGNGSAGSKP